MDNVFENQDKNGKKISLTFSRYTHIIARHPEIGNAFEELKKAIRFPDIIEQSLFDEKVFYHYLHCKRFKKYGKFLRVAIKYLNGDGFIITGYFTNKRP